ncbi:unnamed protein product [Aspergillus oryzae var. brunneus]|uniref:Unnamed protein product n=2 Tax=Aspergillus oryzae TaxID=5062 RepID=A0AAN5C219_ASPOZ|nr:unnamed protein product [Aspergillus oryzae]GMG35989.1 unnamed protein product [Aspergillus oryzae]GMG41882.1 unnamed protein product [Aspergillus oryzae var. brunneus]
MANQKSISTLSGQKKLNETIWKETKEALNGLKVKRDIEITTLKRKLEDANNELLSKQQGLDSLEEYLTEWGLF